MSEASAGTSKIGRDLRPKIGYNTRGAAVQAGGLLLNRGPDWESAAGAVRSAVRRREYAETVPDS